MAVTNRAKASSLNEDAVTVHLHDFLDSSEWFWLGE